MGRNFADWTFPIPIHFGVGRSSELPAICQQNSISRPLLVSDRATIELPFIADIIRGFKEAGIFCASFAEISPNPTDLEVLAGKQAYDVGGHDGIIVVGGGSGMDAGKAISLIAGSDDSLWSFDFDIPPTEMSRDFPPIICVPTTAGTGAETDSTAMITDTTRGIKGCVWHPSHKPVAAILDPSLTLSLPPSLTAWTGADALVHAIEAYSVPDLHPMCDAIALQAMQLIGRSLCKAVETPNDIEARTDMLVGSCLAGVSFLKGLGLVHAISHMVGATHHTQHGLTNAVVLPVVLEFNRTAIAQKVPDMCQALGFEARDFDGFLSEICALLDRLNIPTSLAELGVTEETVQPIAAKAMKDPAALTNPRAASIEDMERLIRKALNGARSGKA